MYQFPAVRGIQSNREFYTTFLTLKFAAKLCVSADTLESDVPLEFRRQRDLSKVRSTRLFRYLLSAAKLANHPGRISYVLPALTCTIDGEIGFTPLDQKLFSIGVISVEEGKPWLLADGQHRIEAIKRLVAVAHRGEHSRIKLNKSEHYRLMNMLDEHIPVTLFWEAGHVAAQQIFADINQHSAKPKRELLEAMDHRRKEQLSSSKGELS